MKKRWMICDGCSRTFPFRYDGGICVCGGVLLVQYDLEEIKHSRIRESWRERPATMWRYHELLPVAGTEHIISLGEGGTPLIRLERWEKKLDLDRVWLKREEQNPTGSFKARGFSAALSLLRERGETQVAVNSNGNAASAMAAYAARAGMEAYVFVPRDCPGMILEELVQYGARACLVDGLIHDAGKVVEDGKEEMGWVNVGTAKEPGRVEGKKTMGLELAEQLGWEMPDAVIYPTGGGSGLIGIWKAFTELKELGCVSGDLPRFITVQEVGCTPIVDSIRSGAEKIRPYGATTSRPTGVRVPRPPAGELILSIIRNTGGTAVAVTAEEIAESGKMLGQEGISASPEGSAVWAGLLRLVESGEIGTGERVALFNTAHSLKYLPWKAAATIPEIRSYDEYRALRDVDHAKPEESS
ncbi:L-threonine synthase [Melghirimyces profundicolus]|uniref:L-threonine synthase n=1 Tax=Melghirimyces profundicolus TaxID=1242148 RepID=A0A2T6BR07_9BACL|nr:threonine synthase [Melghirimyces profundicolus]PTX58417.1 L-threonine synthase [Melghirimyces profundicolus]